MKDYASFAPTRDKRRVPPDLRVAMKYPSPKQEQPGRKGPVQRRPRVTSIDRRLRRKRPEHRLIILTLQDSLYAERKHGPNDLRISVIAFNASSYDGGHQ